MPESCTTDKWLAKKWLHEFMHRHNLSLRVPEAIAFNKTNVSIYFNNLYSVMGKHKFDSGQIYNMDETGCSTVQTLKSSCTSWSKTGKPTSLNIRFANILSKLNWITKYKVWYPYIFFRFPAYLSFRAYLQSTQCFIQIFTRPFCRPIAIS